MKRRTFYHLSLLIPYVLLAICWAVAYLAEDALNGFFNEPLSISLLLGVAAFFAISGVLWGPIYTWMVIVILIWERGKSNDEIRRLYILSPVLLACSMGIPAIGFSLPSSPPVLLAGILKLNHMGFVANILLKDVEPGDALELGMLWFMMALSCLLFGYAIVGVALWIERSMLKRGRFKEEGMDLT